MVKQIKDKKQAEPINYHNVECYKAPFYTNLRFIYFHKNQTMIFVSTDEIQPVAPIFQKHVSLCKLTKHFCGPIRSADGIVKF